MNLENMDEVTVTLSDRDIDIMLDIITDMVVKLVLAIYTLHESIVIKL